MSSPNSTPQNEAKSAPDLDLQLQADAQLRAMGVDTGSTTTIKTPDCGRYCSNNIRLSVALCALGFTLRDDAEPVTRVAELYFRKRPTCKLCQRGDRRHDHVDVAFYHAPEPAAGSPITMLKDSNNEPLKFTAVDIEAWWRFRDPDSPSGSKFSIPGFDDSLNAIRRVLECREWLLCIVHGSRRIENAHFNKDQVVTTSIRFASVIRACGFPLVGFEKMPGRGNDRFVFPSRAVKVVDLIHKCHAQEESDPDASIVTAAHDLPYPDRRDDGKDLCIDWMLWALEYHGRLLRKVKAATLMVEIREKGESDMPTVSGEHVCRIHSEMPGTLRREFIEHF